MASAPGFQPSGVPQWQVVACVDAVFAGERWSLTKHLLEVAAGLASAAAGKWEQTMPKWRDSVLLVLAAIAAVYFLMPPDRQALLDKRIADSFHHGEKAVSSSARGMGRVALLDH